VADEPDSAVPRVVRPKRAAQGAASSKGEQAKGAKGKGAKGKGAKGTAAPTSRAKSAAPTKQSKQSKQQAPAATKQKAAPAKQTKPAARSSAAAATSNAAGGGRFGRLLVPPDTDGPRVRTGVLWFFLVLAAATGGRSWTAALWAAVAAIAAYQTVTVWQRAADDGSGASADDADGPLPGGGLIRLTAALLAALVPVAASYGTGTAGAVLILAPVVAIVVHLALGQRVSDAGGTVAGIVLPALAAVSVVLAVRVDLWAGLFLILAVSLYDAGSFLLGADASGRWEGPVAGMIGALAVTFTMATFQSPPFDRTQAWVVGAVVAVTCPLGQWLASGFLPSPDARVPALRRIDAYLVAGPAFVAFAWAAGG